MQDPDAPGECSRLDISGLNDPYQIQIDQVELKEEDVEDLSDEAVMGKLADGKYHAFVLSETGRPIFMSNGLEDQLCGLFALIGVFVSRVEHWEDSLQRISSGEVHVYFSHRKPIILCIVSRSEELLEEQLNILYDQILSTLSRSQLETIYAKRGDNYDLRRLLRGTDKYMDSCLSCWRTDASLLASSMRIIPMAPSDRDFLSTTMATQIGAAKLDGMMFGLVLAHRQVVTVVRYKKYTIDPMDIHILINLISGNSSMQLPEAQIWLPICLPRFNNSGFFYAYIACPWENCAATIVLLSVKRDHFVGLNTVKERIVEKLEANGKFFSSFQTSLQRPLPFEISKIGSGNDQLWSFFYKNKASKQICVSSAKIPLISPAERFGIQRLTEKVVQLCKREDQLKCVFLRRKVDNVLVWVTDRFILLCIFSPFTSAQNATTLVDRLLKSLKTNEQRYFIIHTASF